MKTIIQQNVANIINRFTKDIIGSMQDVKKLDELVVQMREMTDQLGIELINEHIELLDTEIFNMSERKKNWTPVRISEKTSLITVMGTLDYKRRYYKNKQTGKYTHLVDDVLGLSPKQRISWEFEAKLLENATDISYQKAGNRSGREMVSRQTVKNIIHKYKEDELMSIKVLDSKKEVEVLYVEADEDHISLQNGSNTITKLVYVHEGIEAVSKKRNRLKNTHYFCGVNYRPEKIFDDVYEYIRNNYHIEKIKRIYLMGDGATWIKRGLDFLPECKFVLDQFHIKKVMMKAMGGFDDVEKDKVMDSIREVDQPYFINEMSRMMESTENPKKKEELFNAYKYIMSNWDGISIYEQEESVIGCSAEGHVSHILASRMSSRPMGWSKNGADNIARLRAYKANGGKVIDILNYRSTNEKAERISRRKLEEIINKKLKRRTYESIDNLEAINIGQTNGLYKSLKAIRNAI